MKQFIVLLSLLMLSLAAYEQAASDCNMTWGKPATALLNTKGNVSYNLQYSKCTSTGICGWPKVSISHTFTQPAIIGITLRGFGCDGKQVTASFSTEGKAINANNDFISQGNWHTFKKVNGVVRVDVSYEENGNRYHILVDKDRNINTTTIDGMTIVEFNAAKQKKAEAKAVPDTNDTKTAPSSTAGNRAVTLPAPTSQPPTTVNTASSQQSTNNTQTGNADVLKENATNLIDNVVDKDKLKNDPYAAAQLANAKAAVNATSYADKTRYGTLAFTNSLLGGISEFTNRKREAKAQLQKEMQDRYTKSLADIANIDQKLQQQPATSEQDQKSNVQLIASACKPLAIVFYKGNERAFFDAASLSDKILGRDDIDRINKIFKTVKHDPGDETAFDAARIYILGTYTWRLKGNGNVESSEIPKDRGRAEAFIDGYKKAKSSQQLQVKQIRADYASILLKESFEQNNEANLTDWQTKYDQLLESLSGIITNNKQAISDDDAISLLISMQLKQFYTRCRLYGLNPQSGSYEAIYKDYQTLRAAIAGY